MFKNIITVCITFLTISATTFAQTEDDWFDEEWFDEDISIEFGSSEYGSRPFLEAHYGFSDVKHFNSSVLNKNALGEFKIGYAFYDNLESECLVEFSDKYFMLANISNNLKYDKAISGINTSAWRFGFGSRDGYGNKIAGMKFVPYSGMGMIWTKLKVEDDLKTFAPVDQEPLGRFADSFRFGTVSEGGIKLEFTDAFGISAGYEAAVVFPRYLIWKHLGSFAIEAAANAVVDEFVEEVLDSSPAAAPLVNFVLKNGLAYAFYSLKKESMNWPFETEVPLTFETLKFGLTITL